MAITGIIFLIALVLGFFDRTNSQIDLSKRAVEIFIETLVSYLFFEILVLAFSLSIKTNLFADYPRVGPSVLVTLFLLLGFFMKQKGGLFIALATFGLVYLPGFRLEGLAPILSKGLFFIGTWMVLRLLLAGLQFQQTFTAAQKNGQKFPTLVIHLSLIFFLWAGVYQGCQAWKAFLNQLLVI